MCAVTVKNPASASSNVPETTRADTLPIVDNAAQTQRAELQKISATLQQYQKLLASERPPSDELGSIFVGNGSKLNQEMQVAMERVQSTLELATRLSNSGLKPPQVDAFIQRYTGQEIQDWSKFAGERSINGAPPTIKDLPALNSLLTTVYDSWIGDLTLEAIGSFPVTGLASAQADFNRTMREGGSFSTYLQNPMNLANAGIAITGALGSFRFGKRILNAGVDLGKSVIRRGASGGKVIEDSAHVLDAADVVADASKVTTAGNVAQAGVTATRELLERLTRESADIKTLGEFDRFRNTIPELRALSVGGKDAEALSTIANMSPDMVVEIGNFQQQLMRAVETRWRDHIRAIESRAGSSIDGIQGLTKAEQQALETDRALKKAAQIGYDSLSKDELALFLDWNGISNPLIDVAETSVRAARVAVQAERVGVQTTRVGAHAADGLEWGAGSLHALKQRALIGHLTPSQIEEVETVAMAALEKLKSGNGVFRSSSAVNDISIGEWEMRIVHEMALEAGKRKETLSDAQAAILEHFRLLQ